jgi:hypothetical protein
MPAKVDVVAGEGLALAVASSGRVAVGEPCLPVYDTFFTLNTLPSTVMAPFSAAVRHAPLV